MERLYSTPSWQLAIALFIILLGGMFVGFLLGKSAAQRGEQESGSADSAVKGQWPAWRHCCWRSHFHSLRVGTTNVGRWLFARRTRLGTHGSARISWSDPRGLTCNNCLATISRRDSSISGRDFIRRKLRPPQRPPSSFNNKSGHSSPSGRTLPRSLEMSRP